MPTPSDDQLIQKALKGSSSAADMKTARNEDSSLDLLKDLTPDEIKYLLDRRKEDLASEKVLDAFIAEHKKAMDVEQLITFGKVTVPIKSGPITFTIQSITAGDRKLLHEYLLKEGPGSDESNVAQMLTEAAYRIGSCALALQKLGEEEFPNLYKNNGEVDPKAWADRLTIIGGKSEHVLSAIFKNTVLLNNACYRLLSGDSESIKNS